MVLAWIGAYFAVAALLVVWRVKRVSESIASMQQELRRVHDRLDRLDETLRERIRKSDLPAGPRRSSPDDASEQATV